MMPEQVEQFWVHAALAGLAAIGAWALGMTHARIARAEKASRDDSVNVWVELGKLRERGEQHRQDTVSKGEFAAFRSELRQDMRAMEERLLRALTGAPHAAPGNHAD